jgi:hypothetical protein
MKRVYFVLGLANSGNRMMRLALCASGCYGNPHHQELLGEEPQDLQPHTWPDKVVFARSIPNGDIIPDLFALAQPMLAAGYQITPIHVYRKTEFAIQGHLDAGYASDPQTAQARINLAAEMIHELGAALQTPVVTVIYELLVRLPRYREHLFAQLGLPPTPYPFYNANEQEKYHRLHTHNYSI